MLIGNRYELQQQVGVGGMGAVFRGLDTQTGETVAIKHLKPEVIASEVGMIERFNREGEALRQLNHPNIVKMITALHENDSYYLVLEYMSGGDLGDLLKRESLTIPQTLEIALDLADALTRAHRLNIIHRDLKPANVLIAEDGTPRLTDFGVASLGNLERVTENDLIVGTLDYLAPEALNGLRIDTRADIWAFGVMLFEMLAGKRPFEGERLSHVMSAILLQPTPDLEALRPDASTALVDLVYRMLEKDREARIFSVRLVGAELEAIRNDKQIVSGRPAAHLRSSSAEDVPTTVGEKRFETPTPIIGDRPKHNLPAQTTPFVGREPELAEVVRLLNETRLVTILAAGGMGKTRLSLEAAAQLLVSFPNGVYFVALAPLTSSENIISGVAEAVGFQFYPGGEPKQQLLDFFREKQLLLVMDNFEHLMDGVDIVNDILQAAPGVKIIATSRQRLNLSGETLFNLEGMDFPDWETPEDALNYSAVQLFMQSARRVRPDFELKTDDLKLVARICRLVRGMPLGILLAAAWVDALSLKEIIEEINKSLDFLETEMADIPKRQRSIRAVFEYSWNLLSDDERRIFSKLSVFRGGFIRDAAQAVAEAGLRQLTALVNKSLLRRDPNTGRYEVHELLRQYGEEALEKSGEVEAVRDAHSAYFAEFMHQRETDLKGRRQLAALDEIEADFENIQQAWDTALQQQHVMRVGQFLFSLNCYADKRSQYLKIAGLLDNAEVKLTAKYATHTIYGRLLTYCGRCYDSLGRIQEAESHLKQALELSRAEHDDYGIALACLYLARTVFPALGHFDLASNLGEESVSIFERLGDEFELADGLHYRGYLLAMKGKLPEAMELNHKILELRRRIGDEIGVANSLSNIAAASNSSEAEARNLEVIELFKHLKQPASLALALFRLSNIQFDKGDWEASEIYAREVLRIAQETGYAFVLPDIFFHFAWLEMCYDRFDTAKERVTEALTYTLYDDVKAYYGFIMAFIHVGLQEWNSAKASLLTYFKDTMKKEYVLFPLSVTTMGFILAEEGQTERGLELIALGLNDPSSIGNTYMPLVKRQIKTIKDKLPEEAYAAAWERGKSLDVKTVVAEILKENN